MAGWRAASMRRCDRDGGLSRSRRGGYTQDVQTTAETQPRTLIVTGPARDLLYEHFSRLFWGRGVVVVKDRRQGERRRPSSAGSLERRRADRRRRPPDWIVPPPDAV
jgi:hypothetical protein